MIPDEKGDYNKKRNLLPLRVYPSTLGRDCCRKNIIYFCHHPDLELVIFKVPDKIIILGICVYFILKLMLWLLI